MEKLADIINFSKQKSAVVPGRSIIKTVEENINSGEKTEKWWKNDGEFYDWVMDKWFVEIIVIPWQ